MLRLILIFLISVFFSCKTEENMPDNYQKSTVLYRNILGVDDNLLSLDVYYNEGDVSKKPVVIYVHGGGWSIGDKSQQLENKLHLFSSLNYVFVSVNYRLSPFPYELTNNERVKYPIHNQDVAYSIKWVFDHIETYGGDKNKIVLLGHSAGAQIVALTGSNKDFLESVGLSLAGIRGVAVIDTAGYDIIKQIEEGANTNMYINAFGTDVDENVNASAILNIEENRDYPMFFIAKRGSAQRIGYADDFIAVLEENDVDVTQLEASNYNHFEINNAIGKEGESLITEPLIQFFQKCFQ